MLVYEIRESADESSGVLLRDRLWWEPSTAKLMWRTETPDGAVVRTGSRQLHVRTATNGMQGIVDCLWFCSETDAVRWVLRRAGIDLPTENDLKPLPALDRGRADVTVVKRWDGGFAWVVKKQTGEPDLSDPSELWLEKSSSMPVRVLFSRLEFRFARIQTRQGAMVPGVIQVLQGDKAIFSATLTDVQAAKRVPWTSVGSETISVPSNVSAVLQSYETYLR